MLLGAVAILYASRLTHTTSGARPNLPDGPSHPIPSRPTTTFGLQGQPDETGGTSVATAKPINPSMIIPLPEALAQGNPPQPPPAVERQGTPRSGIAEAAASPDASLATTRSADVPTLQHEAAAPPGQPVAAVTANVSGSESDKPALVVYFPRGSLRAETNARSLSTRIGSDLAKSDFEAQPTLPDDAVIKFSDESNHKLARFVGKSLGDMGYRWRIENTSGSAGAVRNKIEVWLPR
jgi:hypothetical protein